MTHPFLKNSLKFEMWRADLKRSKIIDFENPAEAGYFMIAFGIVFIIIIIIIIEHALFNGLLGCFEIVL